MLSASMHQPLVIFVDRFLLMRFVMTKIDFYFTAITMWFFYRLPAVPLAGQACRARIRKNRRCVAMCFDVSPCVIH
jgi:hypothetical protein